MLVALDFGVSAAKTASDVGPWATLALGVSVATIVSLVLGSIVKMPIPAGPAFL